MFSAPAFASGIVALALLLVLMLLGLRRTRLPFSYEAWRASHGALAAVIAIAGLHHAFTVGELSAHPALRGLWLLLAVLALATLLHGYLVRPLLQLRRPWRVAEVRRLGPARWHLALEPEGEPLAFSAGQFVWLKVGRLPFTLRENPFSVICAPGARRIEFLIREAGDFTGSVGSLRPGDRAWVDGPHGAFTLHAAAGAKRIVMLAGGVGLAPILSMLRAAADAGDRRAFHLVFANRTREQVVPLAAIDDLGARLDLKTDLVLSEPPADWTGVRGQMDARTLLPLLAAGAGADTIYYLCGPPPMVRASLAALVALGVSPRRIVTERFDYE
jgi:predicted ferric reductase